MIEFDFKLARGKFILDMNARIDGMVTGLFGPSGAGKSSLLSLISGLEKSDAGRLVVDGEVMVDSERKIFLPPEKRGIGVVFQEDRLFPHMTVDENLRFAEKLSKAKARPYSARDIMERLEVLHLADRYPANLSGGERQRVALGRTLMSFPKLLLMDEPFSAIDTGLRRRIIPFVDSISREYSVPVLIVSHDIMDVLQMTSSMLIVKNGGVAGYGNYIDLVSNGVLEPEASVGGVQNVMNLCVDKIDRTDGTAELSGKRRLGAGSFKVKCPASSGLRIFDEVVVELDSSDISLSMAPVEYVSIQNQIRGRVVKTIEKDNEMLCLINAGQLLFTEITMKAAQDFGISAGAEVWCLFKAHSLKVVPTGRSCLGGCDVGGHKKSGRVGRTADSRHGEKAG
ncbi:MAG: molybdenum ABC transporter ATP-binding protein [Planctomycetes bacterium]|nr:molybdenum ABC transporter ATP-binding protein [Planctomycetota bacterium]